MTIERFEPENLSPEAPAEIDVSTDLSPSHGFLERRATPFILAGGALLLGGMLLLMDDAEAAPLSDYFLSPPATPTILYETPQPPLGMTLEPTIAHEGIEGEGEGEQNEINLVEYNGVSWRGEYAVGLNSEITVDADPGVVNGTINVDGDTYQIVSGESQDYIWKDEREASLYVSSLGVFAGFIGTRELTDLQFFDPDTQQPFEGYDFDSIDVIDLMFIVHQNGQPTKVVFSIPVNEMHAKIMFGNVSDRPTNTEQVLQWLTPGVKISTGFSIPRNDWDSFVRSFAVQPSSSFSLGRREGFALYSYTNQYRDNIIAFGNGDDFDMIYLGAASHMSVTSNPNAVAATATQ